MQADCAAGGLGLATGQEAAFLGFGISWSVRRTDGLVRTCLWAGKTESRERSEEGKKREEGLASSFVSGIRR